MRATVRTAVPADVDRGLAGVSAELRRRLALDDGAAVRVEARTVTWARIATRGGLGADEVALDEATRENAGVQVGESVRVEAAGPSPAVTVVLGPVTSVRPRPSDVAELGRLLDARVVGAGDRLRVPLFGTRPLALRVVRTEPADAPVFVHGATDVLFEPPAGGGVRETGWERIGGLDPQVRRLREMIELPLRSPEAFRHLGIDAPKGVLLHGPPGCGKTLIARAVAGEAEAAFFPVSGPEIVHKFYGESEAHLRTLFEQAAQAAPSIVFLDEIDAIAPRRDRISGEAEKRLVAQLLAVMDGLGRREQVVVIGATNLPDALDPALRRPGRFDREIAIPVPDRHARREILGVHTRAMPLDPGVDLDGLADICHGFVGADLEALCREAAMARLRRASTPEEDREAGGPSGLSLDRIEELRIEPADFLVALREVQPSALREVSVEVPEVPWSAVGGLKLVRSRLQKLFVLPLRYPDLFAAGSVRPARGVLLHGPPGCGKTLVARAMATESGVNFLPVKGPELFAMHVGESEARLREVFHRARQAAPAILFFDELDALLPRRETDASGSRVTERVLGQFLAELDGIEELRDVLVLGATNRLDLVDPALLRPGRFDEILEVPLPDRDARREILGLLLDERPVGRSVDLEGLADRTDGASGAVLAEICRRATLRAIGRLLEESPEKPDTTALRIVADDLESALAEMDRTSRG